MEDCSILLNNNIYCIVSKEDYKILNKFKWYIDKGILKMKKMLQKQEMLLQ